VVAYWNDVLKYRHTDAEPRIDTTGGDGICNDGSHGSIALWFQAFWKNGPIYTQATMWGMDQEREGGTPGTPPPGSPWKPTFKNPKTIPHEVNIIIVGGGDDEVQHTGIEDATGILDEAPVDWGYTEGHFRIPTTNLFDGTKIWGTRIWTCPAASTVPAATLAPVCVEMDEDAKCTVYARGCYREDKIYGDLWYDYYYALPPIGWVWFTHSYVGGVDGITRSALAEWHYKSGLSYSTGR
jgi:hypothetical protein